MQLKRTRTALITTLLFVAQVVLPSYASQVPQAAAAAPKRHERTDLRTATRKVFENPDGSLEYDVYVKPIHEQDSTGSWVDRKPPGFRKVGGKATYAVDGLPFQTELSGEDSQEPKLSVEQKGHRISFGLGEAVGNKGITSKVSGNTLSFTRSDGGTELQYQATVSGLKESLVLKKPTDQYIFRFPLEVDGVDFAAQDDGSVLAMSREGEVLWRIAPATAVDKKGSIPKSITQTVETEGEQQVLVVTVDPDWLTSPKRAWPVTIDPTVIVEPDPADGMDTEIYDEYIYQTILEGTACKHYAAIHFYRSLPVAGTMSARLHGPATYYDCTGWSDGGQADYSTYDGRSLIKFDLHALPAGAEILDAKLELYQSSSAGSKVDVRLPGKEWLESTATWTFPWTNPGGDLGPTLTTLSIGGAGWVSIPLQDQVREWVAGTLPNWGVTLIRAAASKGDATFVTSDSTTLTKVPHLIVRYAPDKTAPAVSVDMDQRQVSFTDTQGSALARVEVSLDGVIIGDARNLLLPAPTINPSTNTLEPTPLTLSLPAFAGVSPGTKNLTVKAWDQADNMGQAEVPLTLVAPPPTILQGIGLGNNRVQLTWKEGPGSSGNYRLYRNATQDSNGATVVNPLVLGASVMDTPPQPGTYYYWISALSADGVEGEKSDPTQVSVQNSPTLQVGFTGSVLTVAPHPKIAEAQLSTPGSEPSPQDSAWIERSDGYGALAAADGQSLTLDPSGPNGLPVHLLQFPVLETLNSWRQNQGLLPLDQAGLASILRSITASWTGIAASDTGTGATLLVWEPATGTYATKATGTNQSGTHSLTATIPVTDLDNLGRVSVVAQGRSATSKTLQSFATDFASLTLTLSNDVPGLVTAAPAGNGTVQVSWPATALGVDLYRSTQSQFDPGTAVLLQQQLSSGAFLDADPALQTTPGPFYYHVVLTDPAGTAQVVSSGAVTPAPETLKWLSLGTSSTAARPFSSTTMSTYAPTSSTTYINASGLWTADGQVVTTSGVTSSAAYGHGQAFAFNLLNGVKALPGYQGVTTVQALNGTMVGLVLDWVGSASQNGQPLSLSVWNPTTSQWQQLVQGAVAVNSRLTIPVANPSTYVDASGVIWVSVQTPAVAGTAPKISTDLVRVGVLLSQETGLTATRNADNTVALSWTGDGSYNVYRSVSTTGAAKWIRVTAQPVSGGSYTDATPPQLAGLSYALLPAEALGDASSLILAAAPVPAAAPVVTRVEQTGTGITRTGTWSTVSSSSDSGGSSFSTGTAPTTESVSYTFTGTGVALYSRKGSYGKASVYLDQNPPGTADLYATASLYKQKVWEVQNLAPGAHTIKLQYSAAGTSGSKVINFDALDVTVAALQPVTGAQVIRQGSQMAVSWTVPYTGGVSYQVYRADGDSPLFDPVGGPTMQAALLDSPQSPDAAHYLIATRDAPYSDSLPVEAVGQVAGIGAYDDAETAWSYSGVWSIQPDAKAVGGGLHVATDAASKARFPVGAGEFVLFGTRGPDHGLMQVAVNGTPLPGTVDLYSAVAQSGVEIFRLDGITPGSTLEFSPTGTKNAASSGTRLQIDSAQVLPGGVPWFLKGQLDGSALRLTWARTASAATYRIYCTAGCGTEPSPTLVGEVGGGTTTFTVSPPAGQVVRYEVRGVRANATETSPSNAIEVNMWASAQIGLDGRYPYVGIGLTAGTGYVHVPTGNLVLPLTDFVIPFNTTALVLRRTYNSMDTSQHALGRGWRLNFEQELAVGDGTDVVWTDGDGSQQHFTKVGDAYQSEKATFDQLTTVDSGWLITRKDGVQHRFDLNGHLSAVVDRNGNGIRYDRNAAQTVVTAMIPIWADPAATTFSPVEVAPNLQVSLGYDANSHLVTSTLPSEANGPRTYVYTYGTDGYLASVKDPSDVITTFAYDASGFLLRVDQGTTLHSTISYDQSRVAAITDGMENATTFTYPFDGVTATSPLGHPTTFQVNGEGRLVTLTRADGTSTMMAYDALGNVNLITDPLGRQTAVTSFDAWGNALTVTDALGQQTSYRYDGPWHQLSEATDALGRRRQFTYDPRGNLVEAKDGITAPADPATVNAVVSSFTYDGQYGLRTAAAVPVYEGEASPGSTTYGYSPEGWLTTVTDTLGFHTEYAYDTVGQLVKTTDPLKRTTAQKYDLAGRRTQVVAPNGGITTTSFESAGLPSAVQDAMGRITQQAFDAAGRRISVTNALGQTSRLAYDADGNGVDAIDPLGNHQTTAYDEAGRPVSVTDALGNTQRTQYDAVGNVLAQILPSGFTVHAQYDNLNRQVQVDNGPLETVTTYDALGHQTEVKRWVRNDASAAAQYTRYGYDELGRLTQVWDAGQIDGQGTLTAGAQPTAYAYDAAGHRTRVTDALGHVSETVYDLRGQSIRETDAAGDLVTYEYDAAGQMTGRTNGNADTQGFAYDAMGDVTSLSLPDACDTITYQYDLLGHLTTVRDQNGITEYEYDKLGRTTSYRDALGQLLQYGYDGAGRRTAMMLTEGTWTYGYDAAGQLTGVMDPSGMTTTYQYNVDGQQAQVHLPYGITKTNTFDPATMRLAKQEYMGTGTNPLLSETFTYDGFGNVTNLQQMAYTTSSVTTGLSYTYDRLNRLVETITDTSSTDSRSTFAYDAVGNRQQEQAYSKTSSTTTWTKGTTHTLSYDAANRITDEQHVPSSGTTTNDRYYYDPAGRLLMVNSDIGTSKRYEYDGQDRLVKMVAGSAVTTYQYDAEGRRLSRKTVDRTGGTSDAIYYQYDGSQAIVERDGAGAARALVTRGLDGQLLTVQELGKKPGVYVTDYLGSVIQIRDDQQKAVNTYTYDAFGSVTSKSEGMRNDWKFTGANFDGATGLYQLGARYYAPADGRFITQDTYRGSAWAPWTQHLYAYVGNNPVNYVDPTGHEAHWWQAIGQQLEYYVSGAWDVAKNTATYTVQAGEKLAKVIPDFVDQAGRQVIEVKNVGYQYLSTQLKGIMNVAEDTGSQFVLVVREGTTLSKNLAAKIAEAGGVVVEVSKDTLAALEASIGASLEVMPILVFGNTLKYHPLTQEVPMA